MIGEKAPIAYLHQKTVRAPKNHALAFSPLLTVSKSVLESELNNVAEGHSFEPFRRCLARADAGAISGQL